MEFTIFNSAVRKQFDEMCKLNLFKTDVTKDEMWKTYLYNFPEGTNPIRIERTEHDCQCCKQFIRACGNVVAIKNNKFISIWDIDIKGPYQVVANAMSKFVKSEPVRDVFLSEERNLGLEYNEGKIDDVVIRYDHFYYRLPTKFTKTKKSLGTSLSEWRSNKDVFKRGLEEISIDSINTVLDLIKQKSLYKGDENKKILDLFLKYREKFDEIKDKNRDNYCWNVSLKIGVSSTIRNMSIGTLLVDLSGGMDINEAVGRFEHKVSSGNFKRTSAPITNMMRKNAKKRAIELGIENSFGRRYANIDDISINDILHVSRSTKNRMEVDVFAQLDREIVVKSNSFKKIEEVEIKTFIKDIMPRINKIEVMVETSHIKNLMSIIAPQDFEAKNILKWDNPFSWSYNGEVTDSIKQRVKNAGGSTNVFLRLSLAWFNYDDLDLEIREPNGNLIYYPVKGRVQPSSGILDTDMNASRGTTREAVENIVYTNSNKMQEGVYQVRVNQFCMRENRDYGFELELDYDGKSQLFAYNRQVRNKVDVIKFEYTRENGVKIIESLPSTQVSKEVWGIVTQQFHEVSMVMYSPNYWANNRIGNKHYFFIISDCVNKESARGFYNEFLIDDLRKDRKVFDVLGSKMRAEPVDDQLSGVGFSSTQRNHITCKVEGSFTRTIKLIF